MIISFIVLMLAIYALSDIFWYRPIDKAEISLPLKAFFMVVASVDCFTVTYLLIIDSTMFAEHS